MNDLPLAALLCRRRIPPEVLARVGELDAAQIEFASIHGVLGRLLATLERQGALAQLSDPLSGTLAALRRRGAFYALQRDEVVALLRRGGVEPVVLKGGAIADLYFEDPAERQTADLDILVDASGIDSSVALLRNAGYRITDDALERYRRFHFHFALIHPNGHIVELHWALSRASQPFQLDAARVLAGSVERRLGSGSVARVPCPEHMLLHVVLQNLQEGFSRLSRLVDIDVILAAEDGLDAEALVATARAGGLGAPLALSFQLARRILDSGVPESCLTGIAVPRTVRTHLALLRPVTALLDCRFVEHHAGYDLLRLWLTPGAGARLRAWLRLLTPASEDPLRPPGDGWPVRIARWLKVAAYQLQLYAAALRR